MPKGKPVNPKPRASWAMVKQARAAQFAAQTQQQQAERRVSRLEKQLAEHADALAAATQVFAKMLLEAMEEK
ncbi:hypothetical protein C4565_03760 [Candidatus Parcubacteria bacterium]|nr:MAG: hypothetical protein C4565_03760 [Candidatus Parcubacteria bacterium]